MKAAKSLPNTLEVVIVYTVQDGTLIVLVVKIGHRRDVYRK